MSKPKPKANVPGAIPRPPRPPQNLGGTRAKVARILGTLKIRKPGGTS